VAGIESRDSGLVERHDGSFFSPFSVKFREKVLRIPRVKPLPPPSPFPGLVTRGLGEVCRRSLQETFSGFLLIDYLVNSRRVSFPL